MGTTKAELRREKRNRQKNFSMQQVEELSKQISDRLFVSFHLADFKTIHCFLPILKNREIDTWQIIHRLHNDFPDIQVVIPKTDPETVSMISCLLSSNTVLTETSWGIQEPKIIHPVDASQIDCILVPLLAYDKLGYRVGYGKGFYDRFLVQCKPNILKIGLSYWEPVEKIEDADNYDIPLNYCVTPDSVWKFDS